MIKVGYYEHDSDWESNTTYEIIVFVFDTIELANDYLDKLHAFFEKFDEVNDKLRRIIDKNINDEVSKMEKILGKQIFSPSMANAARIDLSQKYHNKEFFKKVLTEEECEILFLKNRNETHRQLQILGEIEHNPVLEGM